jgi:glutamate N-acetyltransferase/amino-acid N-acetyltransferase
VAAGVACGIKASGEPDLALVATDDGRPVAAAAVFTTNRAIAAPVEVSRAHLLSTSGRAAAVVVNSGCANAATGQPGRDDSETTCRLVAAALGCAPEEVLVCSTGLIGFRLPMDKVEVGIPPLVAELSAGGGPSAARAIMTTDTRPKEAVARAGPASVGGMAKGAAMLAPNMATMLAVLTTDAVAEPEQLQSILVDAVSGTFNTLLVDGATSTNDTVVLLASGRAGIVDSGELAGAVAEVCADLAGQMAADAEGATKVAVVSVTGAASAHDARRAARAVAGSQLVQCSLHGGDPYWGRVVSELGSSGAEFDPDRVSVSYGGVEVCSGGVAVAHDRDRVTEHLAGRYVSVAADLGLGDGEARVTTTDLGPGYIEENMRTS